MPGDVLTPPTERTILTNDEVLKEVCKKPTPEVPSAPNKTWLEKLL